MYCFGSEEGLLLETSAFQIFRSSNLTFVNSLTSRPQIKLNDNKSNQTLVFGERGQLEYLGKKVSKLGREPTNPTSVQRKSCPTARG